MEQVIPTNAISSNAEREKHLKAARALTRLLDTRFSVFGKRIGLDPIIGLLPVGGDVISLILSSYIVSVAVRYRLPREKVLAMVGNVALDALMGVVPVVGDLADGAFKANSRNLKILEDHLNADAIIVESLPARP